MPPSSQEPPQGPRRYCALAPHLLKEPNRSIRDPQLLRFAQLINSEMRLGCTLCMVCYQRLMNLFRAKTNNARRHQQRREASGTSMSDVSSSQRMESTSDPSVARAPQAGGVTMRKRLPPNSPSSRESSTSNDSGATTSAGAAAKRNRTEVESNTTYVSDDDDANSNLSLNAVNGTRLPHIQPIPKRRQFVHLNKTAMDIYLAGTTGG